MLDHLNDLRLDKLNTMLHAWIEGDYHRQVHRETGQTPADRFIEGPDVLRPAPVSKVLREAFGQHVWRRIRRTDSTLTIEGVRYEVPFAYRHLERVRVAYARWDLGFVHLVDPHSGKKLVRIFPLDRIRNASGKLRRVDPRDSLNGSWQSSPFWMLREQLQIMDCLEPFWQRGTRSPYGRAATLHEASPRTSRIGPAAGLPEQGSISSEK